MRLPGFLYKERALSKNIFIMVFIFSVILELVFFYIARGMTYYVIIDRHLDNYLDCVHDDFKVSVNSMYRSIKQYTINVNTDNRITDILLSDEEYRTKYDKLREYTSDEIFSYKPIEAFEIVSKDGEHYFYSSDNREFKKKADTGFIYSSNAYGLSIYDGLAEDEYGEKLVVVGGRFINYNTGYDNGYLLLYINEKDFHSMYNNSVLSDSDIFLVVKDTIISHNDADKLGKVILNQSLINDKRIEDDSYRLDIYKIQGVFDSDFAIYSNISKKLIYNAYDNFNKLTILIIFVDVVLGYILAEVISRRLVKEITDFKEKLDNNYSFDEEDGNDEIAALESRFHRFIIETDELMRKNEEAERKRRKAEIAVLQEQINPHFIYNALDSLRWMARVKKQPEIENFCCAMANYFRLGLHKGDRFVPAKNEIEHVKNYIVIEQMRFPGKFECEYNVESAAMEKTVPKLILQPIVENCIKHGFVGRSRNGVIKIGGSCRGDYIIFTVTDNGCGMDPELLEKAKKGEDIGGYGIKNVRDRIALEYGEDCGVFFENVPQGGTRVTIKLKNINFNIEDA